MSDLGVMSQNALSIQKLQMSLIKSANDMQEKLVEILEDSRDATCSYKGQNVDFCL